MTDLALFGLLLGIAAYVWHVRKVPSLRQSWRHVLHDASAMSAGVVLLLFVLIAVLDSVHFRPLLPASPGATATSEPVYSTRTLSLLDVLLSGPREAIEKTYSKPLATHQFSKESLVVNGVLVRDFPRLPMC
jgi:peptide/nickel transport system permease protein